MTEEQRKKLENEAKSWLQIQINEIALKRKCTIKNDKKYLSLILSLFLIILNSLFIRKQIQHNQSVEEELCNEMKEYLEHTYNIISTSFDRHLYQLLKKLESDLDEADKKNFQHVLKSLINNDPNSTKNYYREALNIHSALIAKSKYFFLFFFFTLVPILFNLSLSFYRNKTRSRKLQQI